jgi:hypothetical protein
MTEIHQKYIKLQEFISFLNGPFGAEVNNQHPEYMVEAAKKLNELKEGNYLDRLESIPEANNLAKELEEYVEFKKLLPDTSTASMSEVDKSITELASKLQNIISYDPSLYFETYFLLNGASQEYFNTQGKSYIESEGFKKWFAGSQVVDTQGNPLIVYHGTGGVDFTKWQFDMFPAAYFAENITYSQWFANLKGQGQGRLYQCYLRILNPLDLRLFKTDLVTYEDFVAYIELRYGYKLPENKMMKAQSDASNGIWAWRYLRFAPNWLNTIKSSGIFDGIAFYENNPQDILSNGEENITPAWIVFNSNQIKSVYGNQTYSIDSNDIRFKKGGQL